VPEGDEAGLLEKSRASCARPSLREHEGMGRDTMLMLLRRDGEAKPDCLDQGQYFAGGKGGRQFSQSI
jgi:hypothetical protein